MPNGEFCFRWFEPRRRGSAERQAREAAQRDASVEFDQLRGGGGVAVRAKGWKRFGAVAERTADDVDALLRRAEGGGKRSLGQIQAAQSSMGPVFGA